MPVDLCVLPDRTPAVFDGVDDNRVDITGHVSEVIPEAVADFNLVTNTFSAGFGHSAGAQFNIITKSGTSSWHGTGWGFNVNRDLNARDNLEKGSVERSRASSSLV